MFVDEVSFKDYVSTNSLVMFVDWPQEFILGLKLA